MFLPTKKGKDVLFMKLIVQKLNYKDTSTVYVSSNLCTILLDHICTVVNNGISKPYTVPNVGHTPPSLSFMLALKYGFSMVFYTNTHNGQSEKLLNS